MLVAAELGSSVAVIRHLLGNLSIASQAVQMPNLRHVACTAEGTLTVCQSCNVIGGSGSHGS